MACASIVKLPNACGGDFLMAGSETLYMVAYKDTIPAGTASTDRYVATNGIITAIGLTAGVKYVEIGTAKNTAGFTEELTKNDNGTGFITQTVSATILDITPANITFVESVANQPVSVIIKLNTGKFVALGLNGKLELSALSGGGGVASGDTIGYALTFTGIDKSLVKLVNDSYVNSIIS